MKSIAAALALILMGQLVNAAEITIATHEIQNTEAADYDQDRFECNLKLAGEIERGDLEEFQLKFLEVKRRNPEIHFGEVVLCLDSTGGSFHEALKIAKYLRDASDAVGPTLASVRTKIASGTECKSACTIVFMAGYYDVVGSLRQSWPARELHPLSVLGFHTPVLWEPGGQPNVTQLSKAFDFAIVTLRSLIEHFSKLNERRFQPTKFPRWYPDWLMLEMVSTPANNIFVLGTVYEMGLAGIQLGASELNRLNRKQLYNLCSNTTFWGINSRSSWHEFAEFRPDYSEAQVKYSNGSLPLNSGQNEVVTLSRDTFWKYDFWNECEVSVNDGAISVQVQSNRSGKLNLLDASSWMALHPSTMLSDVPLTIENSSE